jgi:hypothetical protein
MQIEEAFRDLKNTNNGLSLRHCRSFQKGRIDVALLVAAITTLLLWLTGLVAKAQNMRRSFQANSVKTRNVLSAFLIGWQYFQRHILNSRVKNFNLAIEETHQDFCQCL